MMNHRFLVMGLSALFFAANAYADIYRLGIAPVMSQEETTQRYDNLLAYLNRKTGHQFELVTSRNFMGYWQDMRKPDVFDFMLDGAHLAAYRVERRNNRFVARVDGVVSYSLVGRGEDLIIEPDELLTRSIGVLPSPNMSAIAIGKLFHNPSKQPKQVTMNNAEEALNAVRDRKVDAAMVPTSFVARYPGASVIMTTDQTPGMTLTATAKVPQEIVDKVREALLQADKDADGRKALEQLQFPRFIEVVPSDYQGLGTLLEDLWGY